MDEKISSDSSYESNEDGHFAWDVSLLIRAASHMWRLTDNPLHLDRCARWAQHMVDRTDAARGLENWRGLRVPAWSAGSRYTAGNAVVGTIGGSPIRLQAAADQIIVDRPTATTARVHAVRHRGRTWSSPVASLLPDDENYLPDVLARLSASFSVLVRGLPGPIDLTSVEAGTYNLTTQHAAHLVHTGLISRALIEAAETLKSAPIEARQASVTPDDLLAAAESALLVHDDEIRTRAGQAWYVTLEDFPSRRLGLELPHNHVVDAASSYLILGRIRDDKGLRNLGASLTRRFMREIDAYMQDTLRHPWYYYPVDSEIFFGVTRDEPMAERSIPAVPRGEDSSHATMRIRALIDWRAIDAKLVPDEALSSIALSFRRHYMASEKGISTLNWLPGDTKGAARRGQADTYPGAWGGLAPWDSTIRRRINSMAYRHPPKAIFGATVLSAAEIVAMNT